MIVLTLIFRLSEGEPLWRRLNGGELAIGGGMTLLFGLVLGRAWFGPEDESRSSEQTS